MAYIPPKFRVALLSAPVASEESFRDYASRLRAGLAEQISSDEQVSEIKSVHGKRHRGWSVYACKGMLSGCRVEVTFDPQTPTAATVSLDGMSRLEDLLQRAYGCLLLVAGAAACLYAVIERDKGILYLAMAILFVAFLAGILAIAILASIFRAIHGNSFPSQRIDEIAAKLKNIPVQPAGKSSAMEST